MCGIAGFTHRDGAYDPALISISTASLEHRGPDAQGIYQSENISLGAVRLKVIDLTGGDQPMISEDRDTVLVFNGEIYNHQELREELESLGHCFRSKSDTEVVLRSFLQWDKDCFRRLRGMFSLALWTQSENRLLLVRDRLGIKPLYFHQRGKDIYFGSELKALFAFPEIERVLDEKALEYYLTLNYVPGPFTLLQGIEKLLPGQMLEWCNGRVRFEKYWQLAFHPRSRRDSAEVEEELDYLMRESVREHLVADVPVGIWLSGGLDSSTILHYARAACSSRLRTFSITFEGRSFDEAKYLREVAQHYDTEHHELDLNPRLDLEAAVLDMIHYFDEPCADAGAMPIWFLSRLSRRHVTVALSGEGADEFFGGYLTYRADCLAKRARWMPRGVRRGVLTLLKKWPVSDDKISFEYKLKRFFEGSLLPPDEAHTYWNGSFSDAQQADFLLRKNGISVRDLYDSELPCRCTGGFVNRYLAFDQRYYLTDDILQKVDRMSMAHSLEVRPPFLDHRIAEFAASLPENCKIRGQHQKVILKRLMKDKLPPAVLQRPKVGLDIPTHDWLRGPLRPLLLDVLSGAAVEETGLFSREGIELLVREHLARRANLGFHLWGLLMLFLWMKKWNVQTRPMTESSSEIRKQVFVTA